MSTEATALHLEHEDRIDRPMSEGHCNQVRQHHARRYLPLRHPDIPTATAVAESVRWSLAPLLDRYPELVDWQPNELGYQEYEPGEGLITPHRDRGSDQLLSVIITVTGSALIRIHEPLAEPDDYTKLRCVDELHTTPGSVLFLRAAGLGNGERVIHEVLPPPRDPRLILALRMRPTSEEGPDVLPQPRGQ